MSFTQEQEKEGRRLAREMLAKGPVYYNPGLMHGRETDRVEHTEDTLWPYCVSGDKLEGKMTLPTIEPLLGEIKQMFVEGEIRKMVWNGEKWLFYADVYPLMYYVQTGNILDDEAKRLCW